MAYIGSTPTTQSFIAGTDSFNGTGSATNFTLSRLVNSVNDVQVVVNNVVQYPPNYSVLGNTLTISPAPSSGTNNVYVRYLSTTLQTITPSDLTVSAAKIQTNAVTTDKIADANITAAKLNGAQSGSAPIYGARAWVNFNGTGTVAIRASGNVSSITDRGTGLYTVNLTTAMPDANYCGVASATIGGASNTNRDAAVGPIDASSAYCNSWVADNGASADVDVICAAIFR
jgi:hypothetical protein